ncbi:unnamed protein product [Dimorphilus gyrociliatus]|uniref:Uncharacterized protein n=1 Tax=Dimorphilus gyrociliatus TaxID=2664684 RepID=A0A7I8VQY3_9ANNE|nr:unnamed protein product [Dimorphilus gyrociliatus]
MKLLLSFSVLFAVGIFGEHHPSEYVYSEEQLYDTIMWPEGRGTIRPAFVLFTDPEHEPEVQKYSINSYALPPINYVAFFVHDNVTSKQYLWYETSSLPDIFKIEVFPSVVYLPMNKQWNEAVIWTPKNSKSFLEWSWELLGAERTIINTLRNPVEVQFESRLERDTPKVPTSFKLGAGEQITKFCYLSDRALVYEQEKFLEGYAIGHADVLEIKAPSYIWKEKNIWLTALDKSEEEQMKIGEQISWNHAYRTLLQVKQPRLVHNFTASGYLKRKIPSAIYKRLKRFYDKHSSQRRVEQNIGDSHINQNQFNTTLVQLDEDERIIVGSHLKPILERWCSCKLEQTAFYGIREYHKGAVLRNHVDRVSTHVISTILQIHQELEKDDWYLEVVEFDGTRKEVRLEAGEMLLYESAKLIHGRPKLFNGRIFANAFLHFRPVSDWNYKADEQVSGLHVNGTFVPLYPIDDSTLQPAPMNGGILTPIRLSQLKDEL